MLWYGWDSTSVLFPPQGKETIQEVGEPEEGENKEREGEKGKKGEGAKREESQKVRGEVQSKVSAQWVTESGMQNSLDELH